MRLFASIILGSAFALSASALPTLSTAILNFPIFEEKERHSSRPFLVDESNTIEPISFSAFLINVSTPQTLKNE